MGCWTYWTYIVFLVFLEVTKKVFIVTSERSPCVSYRPQLIENAKCCHPSNDSSTTSSVFHPSCTSSSLILKVVLHSCEGGKGRGGGVKGHTGESIVQQSEEGSSYQWHIWRVSEVSALSKHCMITVMDQTETFQCKNTHQSMLKSVFFCSIWIINTKAWSSFPMCSHFAAYFILVTSYEKL